MNILILNWKDIKNPTSGGAEIVTHEHARRWVKKGHTVIWLCSSSSNLKKEEEYDGIKFFRFGNIYSIYFYAPIFYLRNRKNIDVILDEVHGIPFFTPFYVRKPILVLIHEIAGEIWDYTYSFPFNKIGRLFERFYLRVYSNKNFWTDSKFTIDELVEYGIKRNNCQSIPCPSNAKVLQKLPIKNKKFTFISVNRIVKMKGIEDVIDAFSIINRKLKESELWIVGTGDPEYVRSLKFNKIKNSNLEKSIKFWGFVSEEEKLELIKKSHLLLHGSIKEGWGLVVIEAASQATPSVVYNVSGLNESVKNNITGLTVSKNTPDQMATEVMSLISDKKRYNNYQINGLKWAKELNWENAANLSLKLLKNEK